ncbi:glycosyltransferase [Marinilongibacter aquaticus]|uniref:glycosyltransferase n=1 Tax=Marinilongibacter aquaticus TaxID=2975157 RepID=UPI0021BD4635|nr:glycosyltransferase [Marinilongibacter aquaticus]UBM58079.1 glycosyltransferase [Marinilongibacter aquaticus]
MPKILFIVNSSNNGGAMKMIVTLYKHSLINFPASRIIFLERIESQYAYVEGGIYLNEKLSSFRDYLKVIMALDETIKVEKPDAIITFLPLSNILGAVLGRMRGVKVRIAGQRNPPQIYGTVVRFLDRLIGSLGFYTANVCNSIAGMMAFDSYPRAYKKHLSVINNCVEPANLKESKLEAREAFGIQDTFFVLTCVGRLHEQKNHEVLIRLMKYVEGAKLYLAGDGPLREQIVKRINSEGVENKVVLLGDLNRAEVRTLLRATDVFVIPSKYEGLSNSLLEAMSYGLPIVFSNIPSFTTFLKLGASSDEYAGVLVKKNDEEAWAKAVLSVLENKKERERLQNLSLSHVSELTAEKMTEKFLALVN